MPFVKTVKGLPTLIVKDTPFLWHVIIAHSNMTESLGRTQHKLSEPWIGRVPHRWRKNVELRSQINLDSKRGELCELG